MWTACSRMARCLGPIRSRVATPKQMKWSSQTRGRSAARVSAHTTAPNKWLAVDDCRHRRRCNRAAPSRAWWSSSLLTRKITAASRAGRRRATATDRCRWLGASCPPFSTRSTPLPSAPKGASASPTRPPQNAGYGRTERRAPRGASVRRNRRSVLSVGEAPSRRSPPALTPREVTEGVSAVEGRRPPGSSRWTSIAKTMSLAPIARRWRSAPRDFDRGHRSSLRPEPRTPFSRS
jgi:hypothetical protein